MQIRHQADESRFVVENDDRLGILDYEEQDDGTLDFQHTFVPEEHRGRGFATRLVRWALEWARERERRVVPSCPFVADFIERHPEFQEVAV